jgi:ABC-type transport system involved in multi-copper enzyme maturation permease subunit
VFGLGPIFDREWNTLPRNARPQWLRGAWIGLFTVIALTCWLSTTEWNRPSSYLDISRLSPLIFQVFTTVQLVILVFFAALAAASAVALEKDRRTFLLLLITDLSDKEIVLGKILGSLLPLMQLPLAVLPLQLLLVAAGGVGLEQVLIATAITCTYDIDIRCIN